MIKIDSLIDVPDTLHEKRVEQLAALYAEREPLGVSPFDDGSADLEKFVNGNH